MRTHSRRELSAGMAGVAVIVTAGVWSASQGPEVFSGSGPTGEATSSSAVVEHVIDGDTFTARDRDGRKLGRIRILGIDAPELARDGETAQCWARQAATAAEDQLQGRTVTLTGDPNQPDRDDYGRLLRYVDAPDGKGSTVDLSETLIRDGAARRTSRPGQHQRHSTYAKAEDGAHQSQTGLWGHC